MSDTHGPGYGLEPFHKSGLAALAIAPPCAGREELVRSGHHADARPAPHGPFRRQEEMPRAGGVVIARDEQESADMAAAQVFQEGSGFVPRIEGVMRRGSEPLGR